nr:unnamed protein product [Digitaria exilis]
MGTLGGLIRIPDHAHLLHSRGACRLQVHWVVPVELIHGEVPLNLILSNLGIVDADLSLVTQQTLAHINGRGLPGVTSVLLEGKTKNGDLLSSNSVEHGGHNTVHKPALLMYTKFKMSFWKQDPPKPTLAFRNLGPILEGDPLRQECIRGKLGELSGPQVGGEDPVLRNPVGIHVLQSLNSLPALGSLPATDENSIRLEQVLNCCALRKELRV